MSCFPWGKWWVAVRILILTILPIVTGVLCGAAALADVDNVIADRAWKKHDQCAREAAREHPDYTKDSLAQRDRAMRLCLAKEGLPPRADQSPRLSPGGTGNDHDIPH